MPHLKAEVNQLIISISILDNFLKQYNTLCCEVTDPDGTFTTHIFRKLKNKETTFNIKINHIDILTFNFSKNNQVQCTSSLVTSKKTKKLKPGKHIKFVAEVSTLGSSVPNISSIDPGVGIVGDKIKIVYTGDIGESFLFFNADGYLYSLRIIYPIDEPNTVYFIIPDSIAGLQGKVLFSNGNVINKQTSKNQPLLKVLAIAY